jgi:hypothetical protein
MQKKILASVLSLAIFFALGSAMVYAGPQERTTDNPTERTQDIAIHIPNPLSTGNSLFGLLATIINEILLPIGGILAVLAFIYSGFLFVTAQGKEKQIETARRALLYSAIGTAVLLGAWSISQVICGTVEQLGAPACGI